MSEIIGDSAVTGISNQAVVDEAIRLAKEADVKGMCLRIMGGIAVRIQCPEARRLYGIDRPLTDIDYMTYSKYGYKLDDFVKSQGYGPHMTSGRMYRGIYSHEKTGLMIDIFYDSLNMCHKIDFAKNKRLELDSPTITLADILLEKLQIVKISEKDLKDVCIMLREHDIGYTDKKEINIDYINKLLSDDWGFWYTSTINLNKFKNHLTSPDGVVYQWPEEDRNIILKRIVRILDELEKYPKTKNWQKRAKTGTKQNWYKDVRV